MLRIPLDFSPNTHHKGDRFSKTFLEKSFKFDSNRGDSIVTFNLSLILWLTEIDSIPEEHSHKKDRLRAHGTGRIKMLLILLTKIVVFHIRATIIQVGISDLE